MQYGRIEWHFLDSKNVSMQTQPGAGSTAQLHIGKVKLDKVLAAKGERKWKNK